MPRTIVIPPNTVETDDEIILEIPRSLLNEEILYADSCVCDKCTCTKMDQLGGRIATETQTQKLTPKSSSYAAFPYGDKEICTSCFPDKDEQSYFPPEQLPYKHPEPSQTYPPMPATTAQRLAVRSPPRSPQTSPHTQRPMGQRSIRRPQPTQMYKYPPKWSGANQTPSYYRQRHTVIRSEQVPQGSCNSDCQNV